MFLLGPMFVHYNKVLRDAGAAALEIRKSSLTGGEGTGTPDSTPPKPFVTTIHLIGSGLVKLGRLQPATTLYRGITRKLPAE